MGRTYGPSCAGTTTSNVLPNWGTVGDAIQSSDGTETTCCTATAAAMATVNVNGCPFHLTPESSRLSSSSSQDLRPSSSLRLVESGGSCAQTLPSCGSWAVLKPFLLPIVSPDHLLNAPETMVELWLRTPAHSVKIDQILGRAA